MKFKEKLISKYCITAIHPAVVRVIDEAEGELGRIEQELTKAEKKLKELEKQLDTAPDGDEKFGKAYEEALKEVEELELDRRKAYRDWEHAQDLTIEDLKADA